MESALNLTETARPVLTHPSAWRLAWRQLGRDFRAGELRLLVVAVMLAVAALTAVGFFADRINGGLARDARQLLGDDVRYLTGTDEHGLKIAQAAEAAGMAPQAFADSIAPKF